jgi:hypothetical protein
MFRGAVVIAIHDSSSRRLVGFDDKVLGVLIIVIIEELVEH